jgi:hypothetical protein
MARVLQVRSVLHRSTAQRLTRRARGRLDSHRQNELVLALGFVRFVGESRPSSRR